MRLQKNAKINCLLLLLCLPFFISASENKLLEIYSDSEVVAEQYTLQQLQQLPQHEIQTKIPWAAGTHIYKGPYLEDVFALAKVKGHWLTLHGLDQYQISFNYLNIKKFKPILALQVDGKLLTIRSKGPIWVILPLDDYKELNAAIYHDYMVWQLVKINVEESASAD